MPIFKIKPWSRRSKSGGKWPRWLRDPRLLRWAFFVGVTAYRLWRWWDNRQGPTDG